MTQEIMKMKYHPEIQDVYIGAIEDMSDEDRRSK
jgi:exosome complex RNA-binding protein Rrp4